MQICCLLIIQLMKWMIIWADDSVGGGCQPLLYVWGWYIIWVCSIAVLDIHGFICTSYHCIGVIVPFRRLEKHDNLAGWTGCICALVAARGHYRGRSLYSLSHAYLTGARGRLHSNGTVHRWATTHICVSFERAKLTDPLQRCLILNLKIWKTRDPVWG